MNMNDGSSGSPEIPNPDAVAQAHADQQAAHGRELVREALGEGPQSEEEEMAGLLNEEAHHRVEEAVAAAQEGDYENALHFFDPQESPEKNREAASFIDKVRGGESFTTQDKETVIAGWNDADMTQQEAKEFLQSLNISDQDEWNSLIEDKLSVSRQESNMITDEGEQARLRAEADAMGKQLQGMSAALEAQKPAASKEEREEIEAKQSRIGALKDKITGFFAKDMPGRAYSRIAWKTLLLVFLFFVGSSLLISVGIHRSAGQRR